MEVGSFEHKISSSKINFSLFRMDLKVLTNVKSFEFFLIKNNFSFILIPNKEFSHSILISYFFFLTQFEFILFFK